MLGNFIQRSPCFSALVVHPANRSGLPSPPGEGVGDDHAASSNGRDDSKIGNGIAVAPPSAAPREYVVGLYNAYAETFDSHLQGALGYRTPTVIVESLAVLFPGRRWGGREQLHACSFYRGPPSMDEGANPLAFCRKALVSTRVNGSDVKALHTTTTNNNNNRNAIAPLYFSFRYRRCLDLGCGTGLSGQAASSACDRLVGVDLSPAMVSRAREKRVYHRLLVGDVTETVERLCRESSRTAPPGRNRTASGAPSPRGWETPAVAEEDGGAPQAPAWSEGSTAPPTAPPSPPATLGGAATSTAATPSVSGGGGGGGAGQGDLVISCDVFGYIGNLHACFDAVHELVAGGGCRSSSVADPEPAPETPPDEPAAIFAFSAEAPPSAVVDGMGGNEGGDLGVGGGMAGSRPGYELQGTGRWVIFPCRSCC